MYYLANIETVYSIQEELSVEVDYKLMEPADNMYHNWSETYFKYSIPSAGV